MKKEQYFIVRTDRAGVFFGQIESKTATSIVMRNVRKLHYWTGAGAVEQISVDGVSSPSSCRFTVSVDSQEIANWIQILPCTEKAVNSINSVKEWKA